MIVTPSAKAANAKVHVRQHLASTVRFAGPVEGIDVAALAAIHERVGVVLDAFDRFL